MESQSDGNGIGPNTFILTEKCNFYSYKKITNNGEWRFQICLIIESIDKNKESVGFILKKLNRSFFVNVTF